MQSVVILAFFVAQTVLCRLTYNLESDSSNEELSREAIEEIQQLIDFTKKVEESQEPIPKVLQGSLKVTEQDINFYFYNRKDRNGKKINISETRDITHLTAFDTNLDTVFSIHGWNSQYNSTFNVIIDAALLESKDVNVVSVDWDTFSNSLYLVAHLAVPHVGSLVGEFIRNLSQANTYPLDRISLIGHSLGAHICGHAGKSTDGLVSSITGLDPAGPLYFKSLPNHRLSIDDAQYVQAIHTDSLFLGTNYDIGDVDYWPNGGFYQPGCEISLGICSHSRSYYYFGESLGFDGFVSKACNSFFAYGTGRCQNNSIAYMGGPTYNKTVTGDYYLSTNSTSPYALG